MRHRLAEVPRRRALLGSAVAALVWLGGCRAGPSRAAPSLEPLTLARRPGPLVVPYGPGGNALGDAIRLPDGERILDAAAEGASIFLLSRSANEPSTVRLTRFAGPEEGESHELSADLSAASILFHRHGAATFAAPRRRRPGTETPSPPLFLARWRSDGLDLRPLVADAHDHDRALDPEAYREIRRLMRRHYISPTLTLDMTVDEVAPGQFITGSPGPDSVVPYLNAQDLSRDRVDWTPSRRLVSLTSQDFVYAWVVTRRGQREEVEDVRDRVAAVLKRDGYDPLGATLYATSVEEPLVGYGIWAKQGDEYHPLALHFHAGGPRRGQVDVQRGVLVRRMKAY